MKHAHAIMDNSELEIREIAREIPHLRLTHMLGYTAQLQLAGISASEAARRTAVQQLAQKFAQRVAEHSCFETRNDVDGTVTSITCYAMTYDELLDALRRAYEAGFSCGRSAYKAVCAASLEEKEQRDEALLRQALEVLKAENEMLRKDAERYRWLKKSAFCNAWERGDGLALVVPRTPAADVDSKIDAAIDQAMKEQA